MLSIFQEMPIFDIEALCRPSCRKFVYAKCLSLSLPEYMHEGNTSRLRTAALLAVKDGALPLYERFNSSFTSW